MYSVKAARFVIFATPPFHKGGCRTRTCEYQRRHHPDGPQRRCSIHNRPTCPFSAGDGALTEHQKGPRPVSCKINSRFRRFGCGTGQIIGLNTYYIARDPTTLRAARPTPEPTILLILASGSDLRPSARVPSPWTMTRPFVPSTTDLREVQIKMFTSRVWAVKSTLLVVYMSYTCN